MIFTSRKPQNSVFSIFWNLQSVFQIFEEVREVFPQHRHAQSTHIENIETIARQDFKTNFPKYEKLFKGNTY